MLNRLVAVQECDATDDDSSNSTGYIIKNPITKIFRYLVINLHSRRPINASMTEQEFVRQVEANEGIIQKICHLYGHTQPDREDLFQEIVVQLWKAVPTFRGQSKFSTWMYRVALNTAISDFRKKKRSLPVSDTEVGSLEIKSGSDDAINEMDKEQVNALYAAIRQLPEIDKAIVMLYLEERSYEEMEDILGINANNLRVKMNRIKEKLRALTKDISYGA